MKPLVILLRISLVGLLWTVFFVEGIRVIMLTNWRFDIFQLRHWLYAWNLWYEGSWVIDDSKEWAFILIILSSIPLWLTGWATLSLIPWEKYFIRIGRSFINLFKKLLYTQVKTIKQTTGSKSVRKKSYKDVRPRASRTPIDERAEAVPTTQLRAPTRGVTPKPITQPEKTENKNFEHSLFKFDESEDDFEFNFDAFDTSPKEETPAKKHKEKENKPHDKNNNKNKDNKKREDKNQQNNTKFSASTLDVLTQRGYEVISGATIKNNLIDFIGVNNKQICLCILDREVGEWLADEERFNDEEPLWFSESSHRISPVRKISIANQILKEKLAKENINLEVKSFVVVQIGNIINAEDMFDIWREMNVEVTRIDRGAPKELPLFSKTIEESTSPIDKNKFEEIKKLVRNL